jgi:flagellar assembly protein FliH
LSKSILRTGARSAGPVREETVRPWERTSLRPPAPKSHPTVLSDLAGCRPPGHSEERAPGAEAVPAPPGDLLFCARQEAEQLLQQARQEADALRAAAVQAGFADGQAQALDEWAEERQRLRELLGRVGESYRGFCLAQAPELAALAVEAAEQLLGEQLSLEPQRALAIVRQALEQVHGTAAITLHLNPEDVEMLRAPLLAHDPCRNPAIQLAPDPAVERGGCWIESDHGQVDATVAGRVSRLKAAIGGP